MKRVKKMLRGHTTSNKKKGDGDGDENIVLNDHILGAAARTAATTSGGEPIDEYRRVDDVLYSNHHENNVYHHYRHPSAAAVPGLLPTTPPIPAAAAIPTGAASTNATPAAVSIATNTPAALTNQQQNQITAPAPNTARSSDFFDISRPLSTEQQDQHQLRHHEHPQPHIQDQIVEPTRPRLRQESYGIPSTEDTDTTEIGTNHRPNPKTLAIQNAAAIVSSSFHESSRSNTLEEPTQTPSSSITTTTPPEPPLSLSSLRHSLESTTTNTTQSETATAFDDVTQNAVKAYDQVPLIEQVKLPRGGVSMETEAVGRVQFGIPPETIKDSMRLGLSVPAVYIVPMERFCREMGPALGVNLAEFEFPAYFNFFVCKKRCTLVVDSEDAEQNIRRVFSETLLGPDRFRREVDPIPYEEEDFAPDFPKDMIPNFQKELQHFRTMGPGKELVLETLLNFRFFEMPGEKGVHENLGVPPPIMEDANTVNGSTNTDDTQKAANNQGENEETDAATPINSDDNNTSLNPLSIFSQARWIGDVATIWPVTASEEDIKQRRCKRVEIFKMHGGTEYMLHDIDENNHIVGKARFSGQVKVSESMSVDGFAGKSMLDEPGFAGIDADDYDDDDDDLDDDDDDDDLDSQNSEAWDDFVDKNVLLRTFHPPSFGVTVLGNSHGFDKSGSVSGYVLWINGRGVMIDPPPYSSATLEREGIRPRTIVGIILTHCHADHDAGAFQKVLTGSPVVVITTPTIYKSFIRKYAALSALSPALLRHSHRHKPAIIGQPLRFQGATFKFFYTLHSIPCVGFRVEWRGRSMVFTGDHLNSPSEIDRLQESGVLSKARADDLRYLPLQETDLLLHESGAPPLHTPLDVLLQLPGRVKDRLYVVHTSALPEDCELKVAPTGTAGTIRLDELQKSGPGATDRGIVQMQRARGARGSISIVDDIFTSPWSSASNEYDSATDEPSDGSSNNERMMASSFTHLGATTKSTKMVTRNSLLVSDNAPPLVSLRPASSTDAWFILNLLSAVPFLTSLSYASTMEVLETARVDAYCKDEVIVSSSRRNQVLCVVWEGTCVEREKSAKSRIRGRTPLLPMREKGMGVVWHAGDWTGPIALQPEKRLSGESSRSGTHDVVAMSAEGVKVITVEFSNLHVILKSGSALYRKYLERRNQQRRVTAGKLSDPSKKESNVQQLLEDAIRKLNVLELLDQNSALRKLSAVQKRHLESLAEGPISFQPGERLWRADAPVDNAFIVVAGTASFVLKRRNAGSAGLAPPAQKQSMRTIVPASSKGSGLGDDLSQFAKRSLGESMRIDAITAVRELGSTMPTEGEPIRADDSSLDSEDNQRPKVTQVVHFDAIFSRTSSQAGASTSYTDNNDYEQLSRGLQRRALLLNRNDGSISLDTMSIDSYDLADIMDDDSYHQLEGSLVKVDESGKVLDVKGMRHYLARRRSSRARFANKVLGRLYSRQAFSGGLVFSRGHFLGDVSRMVAGLLSPDTIESDLNRDDNRDGMVSKYGYRESKETGSSSRSSRDLSKTLHLNRVSDIVIREQEGDEQVAHNTTLTAGKEGCVVLVFPKASLIPFLDEYPGLLLSLLGTQVVV